MSECESVSGCGAWQQRSARQQPLIVSRLFIMDGRQSARQSPFLPTDSDAFQKSRGVEKQGHVPSSARPKAVCVSRSVINL